MEKLSKSQKDYYHDKIREFEKRTGKSMNVKGVSKFYDCSIEDAEYNTPAAMDLMKNHGCYIYYDLMTEEDIRSNGTNWLKYSYAHVNGKTYKYYFETKQWGQEIDQKTLDRYNYTKWKAAKLDKTNFPYTSDPGEDYLPYAVENKHLGSNFDEFAKDNNIVLKRDINWVMKMLDAGKIMTREGNPKICLFPPDKYDNSNVNITAKDLFAEDWEIFHLKTLNDVLGDLHNGKTIRRKSWDSCFGIGKFSDSIWCRYEDLIADDWEVVDVVAEVDEQQEQILKDRNEH